MLYSECILIQNKYELNAGTIKLGTELPRNGMDILPLRGTSGCHGNYSLYQKLSQFKKNIILVSYFHISHQKVGNEYVYSKDKFWPKSPVVKYSPVYVSAVTLELTDEILWFSLMHLFIKRRSLTNISLSCYSTTRKALQRLDIPLHHNIFFAASCQRL